MPVESLILHPWHRLVSLNENLISIDVFNSKYILKEHSGSSNSIDGWYAKYDEGIFVLFTNAQGTLQIGWKNDFISITKIETVNWTIAAFKGRRLTCYGQNKIPMIDVVYHSYKRFFPNIFLIFNELFIPDDDWGLEADLPSFAHSCFVDNENDLFGKSLTKFDDRLK